MISSEDMQLLFCEFCECLLNLGLTVQSNCTSDQLQDKYVICLGSSSEKLSKSGLVYAEKSSDSSWIFTSLRDMDNFKRIYSCQEGADWFQDLFENPEVINWIFSKLTKSQFPRKRFFNKTRNNKTRNNKKTIK